MKYKVIFGCFLLVIMSMAGIVIAQSGTPQSLCFDVDSCKNLFMNKANALLGSRYTYSGTSANGGFDCSGLVREMIRTVIKNPSIPRSSQDIYTYLPTTVSSLKEAKLGDFLFFDTGAKKGHIGIYLGLNKAGRPIMYHSGTHTGVEKIAFMDTSYWSTRLSGIKRWTPLSKLLNGEG